MPILMWQHGGALLSLHVGVSKAMRGRATYLAVPGFLGLHAGLVTVIVVSAEQWGGGLCTWFPLLVVVASLSVVVLRGRVSAEQWGGGLCTWFPSLLLLCPSCCVLRSEMSSRVGSHSPGFPVVLGLPSLLSSLAVAGKGLVEVVVEVEVELKAKQKISTRSCDVGV